MVREVAIIGIGMHPWGKFPDKDVVDMCVESTLASMQESKINWREVEAIASGCWAWAGTGGPGLTIGNRMLERLGETGVPVVNVYNACATPIATLGTAYNFIATGQADIVLAVGADKSPGGFFTSTYEYPRDPYYLRMRMVGATNTTYWALWARRRMQEVGTTAWHYAKVKEKNSHNGVLNPMARYRRVYSVDEVLNSPMVSDPLTLYEVCATSDGAAAVMLCSMDKAIKYTSKPVKLSAAVVATSRFGDPTMVIPYLSRQTKQTLPVHSEVRNAAQRAYKIAGVNPADVDVIELHDACTYHELAYLEALLDLHEGEADRMLERGELDINGKLPVSPSGGSSSFGEAVAAQGLFQVCELVWQLRGEAGKRQVKDAKIGLSQTYGAWGNCSVCIVEKAF